MQFLEFWQNLPAIIPSGFEVFGFPIRFYGLMYLLAFVTAYVLIRYRLYKKEFDFSVSLVEDFLFLMLACVILGGRIGYVLFYNLDYFLSYPLQIIWPFVNGQYVGIAGMSFHGGLFTCLAAGVWFLKRKKIAILEFADLVMPAAALGYTFGRIGNFVNGELYGRATDFVLAMNFQGELRHPSQLYEAFFEGLVLFVILFGLRKKSWLKNRQLFAFLGLYSFFRFMIEFVREPDGHIGLIYGLSMGQVLSIITVVLAIALARGKK